MSRAGIGSRCILYINTLPKVFYLLPFIHMIVLKAEATTAKVAVLPPPLSSLWL